MSSVVYVRSVVVSAQSFILSHPCPCPVTPHWFVSVSFVSPFQLNPLVPGVFFFSTLEDNLRFHFVVKMDVFCSSTTRTMSVFGSCLQCLHPHVTESLFNTH